jgi:hypothetical protein
MAHESRTRPTLTGAEVDVLRLALHLRLPLGPGPLVPAATQGKCHRPRRVEETESSKWFEDIRCHVAKFDRDDERKTRHIFLVARERQADGASVVSMVLSFGPEWCWSSPPVAEEAARASSTSAAPSSRTRPRRSITISRSRDCPPDAPTVSRARARHRSCCRLSRGRSARRGVPPDQPGSEVW